MLLKVTLLVATFILDIHGVALSVIKRPCQVASECSARAITVTSLPSYTQEGLNIPCVPKGA